MTMRLNNMQVVRRYLHFFQPASKKKEYVARKLLGFSQEQIYSVVADIKNYDKFVPFCTKSTILSQMPTQVRANLMVGFPPIVENYTSVVTLIEPKMVRAVCKDGRLFTSLETKWIFSPGLKSNSQSCIVDFSIHFEFKSVIYSQVATMFFNQLVDRMEDAFISETRRRYGTASIPIHVLEAEKIG